MILLYIIGAMLRCIEFEYRQSKYESNSVQVHIRVRTYQRVVYRFISLFFQHTLSQLPQNKL